MIRTSPNRDAVVAAVRPAATNTRPQPGLLFALLLFFAACSSMAAESEYNSDVTTWQDVTPPATWSRGTRAVWDSAANFSSLSWLVGRHGGKVVAELSSPQSELASASPRPDFTPRADGLVGGRDVVKVDDGWLVGFNSGEFGAALYWFDPQGQTKYKISDHQVVAFIQSPSGIMAIEGLGHLGLARGSLIRLVRKNGHAHWQAVTVQKFDSEPYGYALSRAGTLYVVLNDSIVSISHDGKTRRLIRSTAWQMLYPTSSVLNADDTKLYVGMRQFVGEFDVRAGQMKLLVPDQGFLNKLPAQTEAQIHGQYGD